MLQWLIRAMLLAELGVYVLLGVTLSAAGVSPARIAVIIAVLAFAWRLSHALGSFVVAGHLRRRDGRVLPLANSMAALLSELKARVVSYNWSQAFPQWALGSDPVGPASGTPILLVHGFFSNRGMWVRFRQRLVDAALGPVYAMTLEPMTGTIDAMADSLAAMLAQIHRDTGHEKVIIVAHSMGGLVTRAHMARSGAGGIKKFITLGSPHHGTKLAALGLFACATQMKYGGPWLAALAQKETARPHGVPTLSIYTLNDDLVYPPESSALENAENIPVSGVGHVALLFAENVTLRVIAAIKDAKN